MISKALVKNQPFEEFIWHWQGYQIPYTVMGEGKPLLLIHGFGACLGHWRFNIPVLAEAGYQVYALDLLGFGKASKPNLEYSLELWQEQIEAFWAAHIQQPTVIIGNSIGALLSLMLVTRSAALAAGGVLINCAGGLNHRPEELNLPLRLVMGTFTKLVSSPVVGGFIFNQVRRKTRIRQTLYQVYRDRSSVTDELVDLLYQPSCDQGAREVFASVLTAPAGPQPQTLLAELDRPLLVLWGDQDPWTPIQGSQIYQDLAKSNPSVQFAPIPGAGHCPHDENPTVVNQLILDWLKGLG